MAFKHLALCMLLLVVPAVYAELPSPRAAVAKADVPSPTEASMQRVTSWGLREGNTFEQAVACLRSMTEINMVVNWNALQQFGVTPETPVALPDLKDVTVAKILQLVLDQVSSSLGGVTRLDWIVEDNVVYISTREDIDEHLARKSVPQQKARETEAQINMVDRMKDTYFDPAAAGVVAIGAIKAELQRSGKNVTDELEKLLTNTRSLGLRNALHMTLRDLYQQAGNQAKVMEHLTQMLAENDAASMAGMKSGPPDRPAPTRGNTLPPARGEDPSRGRGEDSRGGGGGTYGGRGG